MKKARKRRMTPAERTVASEGQKRADAEAANESTAAEVVGETTGPDPTMGATVTKEKTRKGGRRSMPAQAESRAMKDRRRKTGKKTGASAAFIEEAKRLREGEKPDKEFPVSFPSSFGSISMSGKTVRVPITTNSSLLTATEKERLFSASEFRARLRFLPEGAHLDVPGQRTLTDLEKSIEVVAEVRGYRTTPSKATGFALVIDRSTVEDAEIVKFASRKGATLDLRRLGPAKEAKRGRKPAARAMHVSGSKQKTRQVKKKTGDRL